MDCIVFYSYVVLLGFGDYGGVYSCEVGIYVLFCNGDWVCVDHCCVSRVVECVLFLEPGSVFVYC